MIHDYKPDLVEMQYEMITKAFLQQDAKLKMMEFLKAHDIPIPLDLAASFDLEWIEIDGALMTVKRLEELTEPYGRTDR